MDTHAVSAILEEMATLLELAGENPYKCRAYEQGARVIAALEQDLAAAVQDGTMKTIKGIGPGLAEAITELVSTGRLAAHDALKASIPSGVVEMLRIPGVGPKKVRALYTRLGVTTLDGLEAACRENRLAALEGFGERSQAKVLDGIRSLKRYEGQVLSHVAAQTADEVVEALTASASSASGASGGHGLTRIALAGGVRRRSETVSEITFVASADAPAAVIERFAGLPQTEAVIERGPSSICVRLRPGVRASLRVVPEDAFPSALHAFTGNEAHLLAIRHRAGGLGLTLTERGLFRGSTPVPVSDEAALFGALGLAEIPPELREGLGEVEAAAAGTLPALVEPGAIRGVFHVHTTASDGTASLETMVRTAQALGYEYVGISDHSQSARYARGLTVDRVLRQQAEIRDLRQRTPDIMILSGAEVDILSDGGLDYPDEVLASFDFVIASVHSGFTMTEDEMTARIIRAIRHPAVTILGHPTGRLLLSREGYPVNLEAVIEAAEACGVVIELNANPYRLDLDWRLCRYAKAHGVPISINPDAHRPDGLRDVRFGVGIARKGWLTAAEVFNTRPAAAMDDYLRERKARAATARAGNA